ncbi:apolipoprotein N-acyltransferase [Frigidibacter albus]
MGQTGLQSGGRAPGLWSWLRPSWRDRGALALLGALIAAGQAPLGAWWLALPALALLIRWLATQAHPGRAALMALFAGAGHFAAALFWIVEPFMVDAARDGWMAPFALILISFGMALFWAGAAALAAWLGQTPARRSLALAVALAGADALRSYVLTGFPWALFGHVWIGTPVAQVAALVGPLGLGLLTTGAAALAALAPRRGSTAALALLAAVWAGGAWRLAQPDPAPATIEGRPLQIRLVQPNAAQNLKWLPEMQELFFERMLDQTSALPAPGAPAPDLIVWPETAVPWLLNRPGPVLEMISAAAGGTPVVLGIQRTEGLRAYNSLAVIGPGGSVGEVYDKHHLVPFGEYMPAGDLLASLGITAFAARQGNGYTPGPGAMLLDLGPLGRALPLICYEAVFPQDLNAAPGRADWLLQATNDAWFGALSGPYQHLAQARLRTIEQGLPLLRAANTGVSAVIDAKGRVLASQPLNTDGFVDAPLPAAYPPTLYARGGDWPMLVLLSLLGLALATIRRR